MPVPDLMHLGLLLSLQSLVRSDAFALVLDLSNPESFVSVRSLACLDSAMPLLGVSRSGASLSALDVVEFGLLPSVRGFTCSNPVPSALHLAMLGSLLPLRELARLAPFLSAIGRASSGFSLLALDSAHTEALVFPRSLSRPGFAPSTLEMARSESPLMLRQPS